MEPRCRREIFQLLAESQRKPGKPPPLACGPGAPVVPAAGLDRLFCLKLQKLGMTQGTKVLTAALRRLDFSEHCRSREVEEGCPETGQSQSRNKRLLKAAGSTTDRLYTKDRTVINNNSVFVACHFHSRHVFYLRDFSWPMMRNLRTGL